MAKVAVDVDDTLYSFNELAQEMITEVAIQEDSKSLQKGIYSPWNEWRSPRDTVEGDLWMSIIDLCHQDDVILKQIPFNHSQRVLQRISDAGHEIMYISNRSPNAFDATSEWLDQHDFPQVDSLVCTTEDKAPFLSGCQYLIDDRPKTLVEFVYDFNWKYKNGSTESKRIGFGLFCEYNRALTDVPGVYLAPNWSLLEKYIEDKGDLIGRNSANISLAV